MSTNDSSSLVTFAVEDGVGVISLNDPATGNSMTTALSVRLAALLEDIADRRDVHCVVIRGNGKCFCSGGNVKDMQNKSDLLAGSPLEMNDKLRTQLQRITKAIHALDVPTIAAVQGPAVGAGCDLALMCDIRIGSESAVLAESFLRLGLVSGIGGAWFLTRIVGLARAMEMTFTSEFVNAEKALEYGILSRVVPDAGLDDTVMSLARRIAKSPPNALRMAKRLVRESAQGSLSQSLELAASMQAIMISSDEHQAAVKEFLARSEAKKKERASQ